MESKVIMRIWHGVTRREHAEEYLQYVIRTGIGDYKKTEGNLSVEIQRHILLLLWLRPVKRAELSITIAEPPPFSHQRT